MKLSTFAGVTLDRPLIMGIVNVTPDSFSDGGHFLGADAAIARGRTLAAEGADFLDIGGESTRPGAGLVTVEEEIGRVVPIIRALSSDGLRISIDTRHAAVMRAALDAGATIINDISALEGDPDSLAVAADSDASIVLMHMQGQPADMQQAPHYEDAPREIRAYLAGRIAACVAAGISRDRLSVDPGIGFGKTVSHNLDILSHLDGLVDLGVPVLLGVSRKSMIASLSRGETADKRLGGSLAAALAGLEGGARILRVHDVAETVQAVAVWQAIKQARSEKGD